MNQTAIVEASGGHGSMMMAYSKRIDDEKGGFQLKSEKPTLLL